MVYDGENTIYMLKGGITIQTAAEILGVSVGTLRGWDRSGKLKARRSKNRYRIYRVAELERFAKKHGTRKRSGTLTLLL